MFAWPQFSLEKLDEINRELSPTDSVWDMLRDRYENTSFSTAFSGVDAPGTSIACLQVALERKLGVPVPSMPHLHAIEWYGPSQEELKTHPHAPQHLAGDITDFFHQKIQKQVMRLHKIGKVMDILPQLVMSGKAVRRTAYCMQCRRECEVPMASIHIAGTPCTDWSSMGTQSGAGGLTMVFLFAWIGLRRLVQEPVIIQENVTKFCVSYLEKFIGDLYFIDVSVEQSGDFGVPCMRERQFIVCRHKVKTLGWRMPLNAFTRHFHRPCKCTFQIFFDARREDLEADLKWAAARKRSCASQSSTGIDELSVDDASSWLLGLTEEEVKHLNYYVAKWPGRVYYLNQNPEVTAMKSTPEKLNTMIKNIGAMWTESTSPPRLMHPLEILTTQCIPVKLEHSGNVPTSSFQIHRPGRSRVAMAGQGGNAMNVCVVGNIVLYGLTQVLWPDTGYAFHLHKLRRISGHVEVVEESQ